jgi:hypothetical protein
MCDDVRHADAFLLQSRYPFYGRDGIHPSCSILGLVMDHESSGFDKSSLLVRG